MIAAKLKERAMTRSTDFVHAPAPPSAEEAESLIVVVADMVGAVVAVGPLWAPATADQVVGNDTE